MDPLSPEAAKGGFNFDNCVRNNMLEKKGYTMPTAKKTGTTIVGVVFEGGVVLGADTRATSDTIVVEKQCEKIHYIADNIMCCGAGTAADTDHTTQLISTQLQLHSLATRREPRVATALALLKQRLFRHQGHISAALVLGGMDFHGPHLYTVYPHGSTDRLPFVTMGSGSLAAMAVFEAGYKDGLTEEDAKELVMKAISAGIFNDLGSGGNVDLCILTKGRREIIKGYRQDNERLYRRPGGYNFKPGTTEVIKTSFEKPLGEIAVVSDTPIVAEGAMDTS